NPAKKPAAPPAARTTIAITTHKMIVVVFIVSFSSKIQTFGDAAAERGHNPILSISEPLIKKHNKTAHRPRPACESAASILQYQAYKYKRAAIHSVPSGGDSPASSIRGGAPPPAPTGGAQQHAAQQRGARAAHAAQRPRCLSMY